MEEILYELREHSAGLNCGIWDYSASFVNKFGEPNILMNQVFSTEPLNPIIAWMKVQVLYYKYEWWSVFIMNNNFLNEQIVHKRWAH